MQRCSRSPCLVSEYCTALVRCGRRLLAWGVLPTRLVAIHVPAPNEVAQKLRLGAPPVTGRIENDLLLLDLRTVLPGEEQALREALQAVLAP